MTTATKPETNEEKERRLFERSFGRPKDYFKLSSERQWQIDKELGILDWEGNYLTPEDTARFNEHYE